jgi:hypothetical protein
MVVKSGCSEVMNVYSSLVICGFSEWNFSNLCWSVGKGLGLSIRFLIRFVVHWVEFSSISWLHCIGVGASIIINA